MHLSAPSPGSFIEDPELGIAVTTCFQTYENSDDACSIRKVRCLHFNQERCNERQCINVDGNGSAVIWVDRPTYAALRLTR